MGKRRQGGRRSFRRRVGWRRLAAAGTGRGDDDGDGGDGDGVRRGGGGGFETGDVMSSGRAGAAAAVGGGDAEGRKEKGDSWIRTR